MSEVNFKSLQAQHESLLQRQQGVTNENQRDFTKAVRDFIEQAKRGGSNIPSTRERDQVRANLRYWANYIYGIEGVFPDTELAPSTVTGSQSFWASGPGRFTIGGVVLVILLGAGNYLFGNRVDTPTPTETSGSPLISTATMEVTFPSPTIPAGAPTSTPVFGGVALTGPENGANVPPKDKFKGVSANLQAEDSIHLLIIRGDRFFPLQEFVTKENISATGEWTLEALLYRDEKELVQPENLIVVPAVCSNQQCRDTLANAVQTGFAISPLPPQLSFDSFTIYRDSSRVLYRNAYQAVLGSRLVYSKSIESPEGTSIELYISKPDGSDEKQITFTQNISESSPSLSLDGTKIVYVESFRAESGDAINYAIAIMDSNGQNGHEITERTRNILASPQWSYDASYISFAMGDAPLSSVRADWKIYIYDYKDDNLSEAPKKTIDLDDNIQPDHTWLPDANSIIFQGRDQASGTIGLDITSVESSEASSNFFDIDGFDEIQPQIKAIESGYLLTYTTVTLTPEKYHNIFAIVVNSGQSPVMLTHRRGGDKDEKGNPFAGADYPIPDPDSNSIYYIRNTNLYKLIWEFDIDGNIKPKKGEIREVPTEETFGDLVIETRPGVSILGYDIGNFEAYFPIP